MMGLASYGEPVHFKNLSKTIKFENDKLEIDTDYYDYVRRIDRSYSELLPKLFDLQPRDSNETLILGTDIFKKYADVASSAQKVLEDLLQKIFEFAFKKTNIKKFLLSGGVAMNSVAVKKIGELPFIDSLNVPPSPGDSGAAIGAALYGYFKDDKKIINKNIEINNKNFYPGKLISDESFFDLVLEKISDNANSLKETSKLIIEDEIIATCYGNIETGPRALGHRSLICNAHNEHLISKLSTEVKKRNLFRPTAPVILEEFANNYFEINNSIKNCYYHMSTVAIPKEKFKDSIKGVVHADNTSRVQICNEEQLLGKILTFLKNDNIFLIANTSFNISSDPMVYSKEDAYLAMERMGIKYLLTEKGLYKKK
jgi:carbamoyltransferase